MAVHFTFEIDKVSQALDVVQLVGTEALSELFQFEIHLISRDRTVSFADVVGASACLTIAIEGSPRFVHGEITRFEESDEGGQGIVYRAILVPRIARLRHRVDMRIFQALTVPQIIEQVLDGAGIPKSGYRLSLSRAYAAREYCVQYRESDLEFVRRLMDQEGMIWSFEHSAADHVLVLSDSSFARRDVPGFFRLRYSSEQGLTGAEHVTRFRYGEEVSPGKVTLRDYDFKRPGLLLEGARGDDPDLEVYDYPGSFQDPRAGAELAAIRLDQAQTRQRVGVGEGTCASMSPGFAFTLINHPNDALNKRYLLTSVKHRGAQPLMGEGPRIKTESYSNTFECSPDGASYRPAAASKIPVVMGPQTAIVVGPSKEEIFTDEHGRVKVQFHWDRRGKRDEKSSCWIRVSQGWAGGAWGAMYIPRVGHEVIVEFLEGDPDRPIITGRVYHGVNVPPYTLPAEKSKSTLKSRSTPDGQGSNELRFEDKRGEEQVYLHAEKNWDIHVNHDKTQSVGHDESLQVGHDRSRSIGHDERAVVGNDQTSKVGRDRSEAVARDARLDVGRGMAETIKENRQIKVGGDQNESIGHDMRLQVGHDRSEVVMGASDEHVLGSRAVTVDRSSSTLVSEDQITSVGGNVETKVEKKASMVVGERLVLRCGEGSITVQKNGDIVIAGKDITIHSAGPVLVEGEKVDVKSDGVVNVDASGPVNLRAAAINMN